MMKRAFVCSPLRGLTASDRATNERYAEAAGLDSVHRGEAPYVPHLYLTRFLDDSSPAERDAGIAAGMAFLQTCDMVAVYSDRGVSQGMSAEIALATDLGIQVEIRSLGQEWARP
jgi:hypothetical protein